MARKIKPRAHARPPIRPLDDKGVLDRRNDALIRFNREFCANLPQHEGSGQQAPRDGAYVQVEGDRWHDKTYPIADGRYRVSGSEWVFVFEGGGFVEAMGASADNKWGGAGVIGVDVPPPAGR